MKTPWTALALGLALCGPAAAQWPRAPAPASTAAPISPVRPAPAAAICSGHGRLVAGLCACAPGWSGSSCEAPAGSICNGHGELVAGRCVCTTYWMGPYCEVAGLSLTGRLVQP